MFAQVALPLALQPLTYKVPAELLPDVRVGSPVLVPLRKRKVSGYVSGIDAHQAEAPRFAVKDILGVDEDLPALDPNYLRLLQWISDYYHYPLGEVIQSALPPTTSLRKEPLYMLAERAHALSEEEMREFSKRGGKKMELIALLKAQGPLATIPTQLKHACDRLRAEEYIVKGYRETQPRFLEIPQFPNINVARSLSREQAEAYETIRKSCDDDAYKAFLLQGVTGSGKTEVYLSAAEYVLARGRGVMILVPEIALTPQLLARVRARLGNEVAVLHSDLTDVERRDQWTLIHRGIARVVLGARSTIFAPLRNVGLIIVDEEHETAFKQEDRLKYNARDMALLRGSLEKAVVILGSATPSLESFYHSITGKMERIELKSRFAGSTLPNVEIVDLRREKLEGSLSGRLLRQLERTLERGKQAVLFLNRRGFASFLICEACGEVPECPNCSVSLTHYKRNNSLQCHYCGHTAAATHVCAKCGTAGLSCGGLGTESLEIELAARFPTARIVRIDRETTQKRGELEKKLRAIAEHKYDFIIGTQMIAKGHDFPNIELAAIVNADVTLNVPDFRSTERAFQLFTQVAGRAGRGISAGTVLLQTYDPGNPAIVHARDNAHEAFARAELESRATFHYPPFYRLVRIVVSDSSDRRARDAAFAVLAALKKFAPPEVEILGPAPAVLHKLVNRYRWNILLKAKKAPLLNALLKSSAPEWKHRRRGQTNIGIDVDPMSLM